MKKLKKLNEKAAKLLAKDLDQKALAAVTGAGCSTCGLVVTTGLAAGTEG